MKKLLTATGFLLMAIIESPKSFAGGKTGHEVTGSIAFALLDDYTRKVVFSYLGNLTFEEAANWMDNSRSNPYYSYMRTWHYININKGEKYVPSKERNILTVLHAAITNLTDYKNQKRKDVKRDLLLIFHLVGDLHQPLHTGYAIDKGGNTIQINSPFVSGNLHKVWDTQIIEYKGINMDSCMALYKVLDVPVINAYQKIEELKWMYQSRSLPDKVYSFQDNFLDAKYIDVNAAVIKKQLLIAGIRLAAILRESFRNK